MRSTLYSLRQQQQPPHDILPVSKTVTTRRRNTFSQQAPYHKSTRYQHHTLNQQDISLIEENSKVNLLDDSQFIDPDNPKDYNTIINRSILAAPFPISKKNQSPNISLFLHQNSPKVKEIPVHGKGIVGNPQPDYVEMQEKKVLMKGSNHIGKQKYKISVMNPAQSFYQCHIQKITDIPQVIGSKR